MTSHELEYELLGSDIQLAEILLDPGETVVAEAGAMNYMDPEIAFKAKMGDGGDGGVMGKLLSAGKRALSGESLFLTHFTNEGTGKKRVAFAAPYPGRIVALDLSAMGGSFICQKDAFLCAARGTKISVTFHKKLGAGFFGGEGFILQKLTGDGLALVHAGGTVIEKKLDGGSLLVDTGCLVGFTGGIDYDIKKAGNLKSMFFGGEGFFLAKLSGTGTVYVQSLPFSRLADRVIAHLPDVGIGEKG